MSDDEYSGFPVEKEKFDINTGTYQGHNVLNYKPWQVEKYTRNFMHWKGRYSWRNYDGKSMSKRRQPGYQLKQSKDADLDEYYDEERQDNLIQCYNSYFFDDRTPEYFDTDPSRPETSITSTENVKTVEATPEPYINLRKKMKMKKMMRESKRTQPQKLYVNVSNVTSAWFNNSGININKLEKQYGVTITWKNATNNTDSKDEIESGAVKPAKEVVTFTIMESTNSGNEQTRTRLMDCIRENFWSDDEIFFYKFYLLNIRDRTKFEQFTPENYSSFEELNLPKFAVEYFCKCDLNSADEFGKGELFMQKDSIQKYTKQFHYSVHEIDHLLAKLKLLQQTENLQIIPDTDFYGQGITRMHFQPKTNVEIDETDGFEIIEKSSNILSDLEICIGHDRSDHNKVLIFSKSKIIDKLIAAKIFGCENEFTVIFTQLTSDGDEKLKVINQNLIQGVHMDGKYGFSCAEMIKNRNDFQMTFNMPLEILWQHFTA